MRDWREKVMGTILIAILLAMLVWAFYPNNYSVTSRKSKPPVKIKYPSEIKDRTDICEANYGESDTEANSGQTVRYDVQA